MSFNSRTNNKIRDLASFGVLHDNLRYTEFKNLLMNAVKIERTDGVKLSFVEEILIKDSLIEAGQVGFDKSIGRWFDVDGSGVNEFGKPITLIFKLKNGSTYRKLATYEPNDVGAYYIQALPNLMSLGKLIEETTDFMANCDLAIKQNINACKMPFIVVAKNEDLRLSIEQAVQQQQDGKPVIVVNDDLGEALKSINTNVTYLADKFELIKSQHRDRLFNKLGIMSANVEKKERVQVGEVNTTIGQCTDYIYLLIDTFNKQMDSYDLPFKMSMNGALEELYLNENGGNQENDKSENNNFNN